ncbi:CD276 antigen-like isoform X2 [Polyodon spathula]|uniref:CD276 antigen-like isoform X2 n=1 Tax=Polyodon spathula TaxID=7913 RepID=UPI001B7EB0AF|nr:CD276 antigen-like isoform X2 [Polyodon spathula]
MKIFVIVLILLVVKRTGGSVVNKITAARGNDIWLDCTFDAARMRQDKAVWWSHCKNSVCTDIQHFRDGVDQLQDMAASRRGRVYPDKFRDGNASLFIENVQMSDEGLYELTVILTGGPYNKIFLLTVLASSEPPELTEALDTRSFTCSSRNGFPPALVTWTGGSGKNYTPDSVTQHTLNPEGLYDVVSKLTRSLTEEETICCTVWNQPLQEHKTNCTQVTPESSDKLIPITITLTSVLLLLLLLLLGFVYIWKGQNLTRKRKRISHFTYHTVTVLIGRPQHGVPSVINSCVFAYKAEEPFENWAGADKKPPHYALPEEVPLTEHITITRALLEKEDRFWTDEREAYLDKWRREERSHRHPFVFVHRLIPHHCADKKELGKSR